MSKQCWVWFTVCVILQAAVADTDRKPKLPLSRKYKLSANKRAKLRPSVMACFMCSRDNGGDTVRCSHSHCAKIYHLTCLMLDEPPKGRLLLVLLYLLDILFVKLGLLLVLCNGCMGWHQISVCGHPSLMIFCCFFLLLGTPLMM